MGGGLRNRSELFKVTKSSHKVLLPHYKDKEQHWRVEILCMESS